MLGVRTIIALDSEEMDNGGRRIGISLCVLCGPLCLCGELFSDVGPPQRHRGPQRTHKVLVSSATSECSQSVKVLELAGEDQYSYNDECDS